MAKPMTSPADDGAAGSGHNLTEDTFLHFVAVNAAAEKKLKEAQGARKAVRKQAKAAGIELGHMDAIVRMGEWDRTEVQAFFQTRLLYAKWYRLGGLVGDQGEFLFGEKAPVLDDEHDAAHWSDKGFQAGVLAQSSTPPDECHPQFHQDFQHGWSAGQAKNAEGIKPLTPPRATKPSSATAKKVLEQARADEAADRKAGTFMETGTRAPQANGAEAA